MNAEDDTKPDADTLEEVSEVDAESSATGIMRFIGVEATPGLSPSMEDYPPPGTSKIRRGAQDMSE